MSKQEELTKLKDKALKDDSLPLKKGATNLVFGVGNVQTEILFLGEGPGRWEDLKAEPFVGNAGMLLNQLLQMINIKREDVFITNIVMHRPPENRDPVPEEIDAYKPYVDGIIKIIEPKMIVTLGRFSMSKFLPGVFISNVHGKSKVVEFGGKSVIVVPMYHPAAALRNSEVKDKLKRDFEQIPELLSHFKEVNFKEVKDDIMKDKSKSNQMNLI